MDGFQATGTHVGINFRRYDTSVSEQPLDDSQVGAVLQHVSWRCGGRHEG
jgi:hypothetical protein